MAGDLEEGNEWARGFLLPVFAPTDSWPAGCFAIDPVWRGRAQHQPGHDIILSCRSVSPPSPRFRISCSHIVTLTPMNDSVPILEGGRIKPGIYKIRNIFGQTYLETREHFKELHYRPTMALGDGEGLVRLHVPAGFDLD